jgi:hypothetical protein
MTAVRADFGWFAGRAQALVKGSQDVVTTCSRQRRHVEAAAHERATTTDTALATPCSTIAVKGRKPG